MTQLRPWHRFRLGGTQRNLAGPVVVNESLDQMTAVADCELWDEPSLSTGTAVDLYFVEREAATITAQFAGALNHVDAESYPNKVILTCNGPLANLRRVRSADVDLSGLTDGDAVENVLTYCGIGYTGSDIQDAGYVLGAQLPVIWHQDQSGWEVIRELDRVFGMATIEVGAGRVVRFAYDRAPDAADISATFTRGVDADFWRNNRGRGNLDAIVNAVQVRGATWEDAGGCRLTPWARGEADHAKLGAGVRNQSMPFASDVIQDEALAGAIATRLLRWYNREPDELVLETFNDPNVGPGDVIGVRDEAYGVDLTAAATATPYLVLIADRRGATMTLTCVGGAAGATGTLTTGVERVCNDTSFDFDLPGAFTPPAIQFPPLIPIGAYNPLTDGAPPEPGDAPGGAGDDHNLLVHLTDWVEDNPSADFSFLPDELRLSDGGQAHDEAVDIDPGQSWAITGTLEINESAGCEVEIGVGETGTSPLALLRIYRDATAPLTAIDVVGWGDFDSVTGLTFAAGSPITFVLLWDAGAATITGVATQGATEAQVTVPVTAHSPGAHQYVTVGFFGPSSSVGCVFTDLHLEVG